MKNEVSKRGETRVLYEPPEPLFPDPPPRKSRVFLLRLVTFAVLACVLVLVWVIIMKNNVETNQVIDSIALGNDILNHLRL